MKLRNIALALAFSASLIVGCGGDDAGTTTTATTTATTTTTTTTNRDAGPMVTCAATGEPTLYRINSVVIPTTADVLAGAPAGHNVDGVGSVCGVDDGPNGVDNAIVNLLGFVVVIAPELDVQELINVALACDGAGECLDLELIISVRTGPGCVAGALVDAAGNPLSDEFAGTLDGSGAFVATPSVIELSVPVEVDDVEPFELNLTIRNVILTGNLSPTSITDIIIGGVIQQADFEGTIMPLTLLIPGVPAFEKLAPIIDGLYDVRDQNGACTGMSIGLLAEAVVLTEPAAP